MSEPGDFSSELNTEFEDLVIVHHVAMYKFALARIGNSSDAQDIVQETFLKAYRSFDRRSSETETKSWLRRILINSICDFYRKKARTVSTVLIDESESAQNISSADRSDDFEIDSSLQQALNSMSEQFVIPLLLREMDDATYEEISEILGIPTGTVMSRLSRARSQLRRKLADSQNSTRTERFGTAHVRGIHNELQ